jgi:hypothetical protein
MGEEGHDQEFILMVEATGLDIEQVEALKKGFEGFDKVDSLIVTVTIRQKFQAHMDFHY